MQLRRFRFAADWQQAGAAFNSSYLDAAVYVGPYQHPAVLGTAAIDPAQTQVLAGNTLRTGTVPADVQSRSSTPGGNLWTDLAPFTFTPQAGDAFSFSTTARQVQVRLAGIQASGVGLTSGESGLQSGTIHNGAVATVSVDGVVQATIDTYGGRPLTTLYLDGTRHTILITHTGGYNMAIHPIGAVTPLVGASVAAGTALSALYHPTFITASWRIAATDATHYTLFRTLPGASETTIATGLVAGTTYADSAHVPGVSLVVTGTLTTGDSATFTTDVTMVALERISLLYGTGTGPVTYQSPVIDAGASDTQWFLAEWAQSVALPGFALTTGNTPAPDATWSTAVITPTATTLPSTGTAMGLAGLVTAPRGRYARFTLTFPGASTVPPWVRDLSLYSWVPERDPHFLGKVALASSWRPGPLLTGYAGTLATFLAATRQQALDYVASFAIGGSIDQYLAAYGADLGLTEFTAEAPQAFRQRILAALQSRQQGGSRAFIAQQVALLTGFPTSQITVATLGAAYQYSVTVPPPVAGPGGTFYPGLPGLPVATAQTLIKSFISAINPVTSVVTPLNSSSNVVFG